MENKELTLNEYQKLAMTTCMPSCFNYAYMLDNLMAEVGEFAGKVSKAKRKKLIRFDHEGNIVFCQGVTAEQRDELLIELKKEAGDILWQASGLCEVFGWELNDVAQGNLDKLASRKQRGVIVGDGDNR
jgi:NTP pyrophosphatase (non-canonical NTP hydrolase)